MSSLDVGMDCSGRQCGYGEFAGDLGCTDGGSCFHAEMLQAKESRFHDATLAKATSQINEIIASIPDDPDGRQLSFLHTPFGTMLAWVRHDVEVPEEAVRADSSPDQVISSLGLLDPPQRAY
ncbi:MAG: hypothetical protein PSX80_01070 [bacterium]|nr:hypothetical protein [bacterium]